jgi:hypothetical protein
MKNRFLIRKSITFACVPVLCATLAWGQTVTGAIRFRTGALIGVAQPINLPFYAGTRYANSVPSVALPGAAGPRRRV